MNSKKHKLKYLLQRFLGFNLYLFVFSVFKSIFLKYDKNEFSIFVFLDKLPNHCTIIDIGANIGITTQVFCKKQGVSVKAFEPIKTNYEIIEKIKRLKKLNNLELFPIALGASKGIVQMVMPIQNGVIQQGLSHVTSSEKVDDGIFYNVEIETLDNVINNLNISNNLGIKIDVEGFEYDVLLGALETIKKFKPIFHIELWEKDSSVRCLDLFKQYNYKIMGLKKKELVLIDNYNNFGSMTSNNFICIPN